MIGRIKQLEAKFQILPFMHRELFEHRSVPGEQRWALQRVPRSVAESSGGRQNECSHVEKSGCRLLVARQIWRSASRVQANFTITSGTRRINARLRIDGKPGLPGDDRTELPTTDNLIQKTAPAGKTLSPAKGQFVERGGDKAVWHVESGITVIALHAAAVLWKDVGRGASDRATIIK